MTRMTTRRDFLALTATASVFAGLAWRPLARASDRIELIDVPDRTTGVPLLKLPPDFSYVSHGWRRDPMEDGNRVPGLHDGMGAFLQEDGHTVVLVRNHEITKAPLFWDAAVYDPRCGGGTTTLAFDLDNGEWLGSRASLAGTNKNCAGGPTPWGSWLTCEETTVGPGPSGVERRHGFVFEVPANGVGDVRPLMGLGRFKHEAAAVDPATGIVYLTEDEQRAGLYRFVPDGQGPGSPGSLHGPGRLQMLAIEGRPNFTGRWPAGLSLSVAWVDIEDPARIGARSVFRQGHALGGLRFKRLEGCWWDDGHLYFVSTSGGAAGMGQIWELDAPAARLRLLYESPGRTVLDGPDNLMMMTNGALLLCEDGSRPSRLSMLTPSGRVATIAENNVVLDGTKGFQGDFRDSEWCGACQAGDWVFANLQIPGITLAITGPWDEFLSQIL